jgi:hypothetical protein
MPLCEKPREHCINGTATNHSDGAGLKLDAKTNAADERLDTEIIAPPVRHLPWIAPLEAPIKGERDENWHANNDGDERKNNEIGSDGIHQACGEMGTYAVIYHLTCNYADNFDGYPAY